jgi:hypothetical protein
MMLLGYSFIVDVPVKILQIRRTKMDALKKFFPLSFKYTKDVANLIIGIIIYVLVGIVAGVVIGLATLLVGWIPVVGALVGWILGIVGSLVGVYTLAGIIIQILVFAKVLK